MEPPFDLLRTSGVIDTVVGYTGGKKENPTYEEVSGGSTGHREAIEVQFDPAKISYEQLLEVFWRNIDPYDAQGQFCDKGFQYSAAIYYTNEAQKAQALESKKKLRSSGRLKEPIQTEIVQAAKFYPAEKHHQDYYQKNPVRYRVYRFNCGRDSRLKKVWSSSASH